MCSGHPEVRNVICNGHFAEITLNYHKLIDLNMTTIMGICKIGKITIGSIEGGPIEKKIAALSHCVGD